MDDDLFQRFYGAGTAVRMQDGGKPPKRGVSSLPGYGEGIDDPTTQALLAIRRNLGEAGRAAVGAKPYDETNPTETYRAMQALFNAPTPAAIIPEAAQAAGKAAGVLSGLGALGVVKPKGGAKAAKAAKAPTATKPAQASTDMTRLYHGGRTANLTEVPKGGSFDGFFGSPSKTAALSHGSGQNYYADIPKNKILTNYDLNYELPHANTLQAFTKVTGIKESDPNFESAWKAIIEDQGHKHAADADLFDVALDDPGWIAQKKRGQIAKELGYQAVEMADEHGTSYLMAPGVPLSALDDVKKASGGAVHMQDGGKPPPGIKRATERAKESKSVLPVAGARQARQAIQGYLGMDPSFSVMDPEAQALESAYRGGESASVLGDLAASLTPFATASALSKVNQTPGLAQLIAYHGSPHKFKKFDASKIGTGEGAQAYGHGLYFAENPEVAKDYADVLASPRNMVSDKRGVYIEPSPVTSGKYMLATKSEVGQPYGVAGDATQFIYADHEFPNIASAIKFAKRQGLLSKNLRPRLTAIGEDRKYIPVTKASDVDDPQYTQFIASEPGSLYTVDIPDEKIAQMLDWDKPLSQQPKAVRDALKASGLQLEADQIPKIAADKIRTLAAQPGLADWAKSDLLKDAAKVEKSPSLKHVAGVLKDMQLGYGITPDHGPFAPVAQDFLDFVKATQSVPNIETGGGFLSMLQATRGGPQGASQALREAGIPGIQYLDQASRDAKQGTRNFVIFPGEEQNIKMLDINGEPQMARGGAVRISDNPDTMLLELMGAPRMQAGGAALKAFRDKLLAQYQRSLAKDPGFKQAPGEVNNLAGKSYAQWAAEQQYKHELEDALAKLSGVPGKKMSVQDLPVGSRLVSIIGDRTQADKILRSVNETPLANEVILHGGPRFGQGKLAQGKEDFWASQDKAAQGVQNRVEAAAERAKGKPVIGVYTAMSAKDSDMYAKHFAEALIEQYPFTGMTGKQVDAFNKEFRKKYPQFAGVDNPEFVDQIMANTEMRKAFVSEHLKKKNIEKFNIPDGLATRHAITVPELRDVPTGLAGYSVGEMKPGMALEKGSYLEHPTYNTVIPGRYMGGLEIMHDYRDLFPEATQRMRQTLRNNPKFQGPGARDPESQMFGTFGFQGAEQEVTQKLIDELAAREELIKQLGILPYKKGGKVQKVKVSDNPDTMRLELLRKKHA